MLDLNSMVNDVVKEYCGLDKADNSFDAVFEASLGSSMLKLNQLSNSFAPPMAGPYLTLTLKGLGLKSVSNPVLSYLCLNARLAYDPPSSAQVMQALKDEISQLEFRISVS